MSFLRSAKIISQEGTTFEISLPREDLLDFLGEFEEYLNTTEPTSVEIKGRFSESALSETSFVHIILRLDENQIAEFLKFRRHFSTAEDLQDIPDFRG